MDNFITEFGYWKNKKNREFKRYIYVPNEYIPFLVRKHNNIGIFKTVYFYESEDVDNSSLIGDFYLDFDSDSDTDGFELVRKDVLCAVSYLKIVFNLNPEKHIRIFFSGNKGIHITIPYEVFGIEPMKDLNEHYKTLASKIKDFSKNKTVDTKIYDRRRIFRIENSIHESSNKYKIELTLDEIRDYDYEDILKLASNKRFLNKKIERNKIPGAVKVFENIKEDTRKRIDSMENLQSERIYENDGYVPPCIEKLLGDGACVGERNNSVAVMASYYKVNGFSSIDTFNMLKKWNVEKNVNLSERELKITTNSMYTCGKTFGCSSIRDNLGLCDDNCKYKKR